MTLRRILQLLNVRRTIRLERDTERLMASSLNLAQSTERLAAALLQIPAPGAKLIDTAVGIAARGSVVSNLETIQHLMETGQIKEAKLLVDSLILITQTEGNHALRR